MMRFRYVDFLLPDGKTAVARPMMECLMLNPQRERAGHRGLLMTGLLDSGSDFILVSRQVGEFLGLDLSGTTPHEIVGLGGSLRTVTRSVTLMFSEGPRRHTLENVPIEVDIVGSQESTVGSVEVIFGRRGIFSEFDIEFRERNREVLFRR